MKNSQGQVLYVGKAKNLRVRLKQYFAEHRDLRAMVPYLISQVEEIDTIVALTEKDALLLENNLIKKHWPKYNVLLKDDKTFISLVMTKHEWPMLRLVRYKGKPKNDGLYFGPYTNALAARQTYDLLLRLFPLRQCSDAELSSRERPCLLYDIKRCIAPCVGKCTKEEYEEIVKQATRLLKGKDKEVIKHLNEEMVKSSEALEFEKAADFLRTIKQLEHVTTVQHVENPFAKDADVIAFYKEADALLIALLLFREGKLIGSEHFSFHQIASEESDLLESFLIQHYTHETMLPQEIIIGCELSAKESLEEILSERASHKVVITHPKIGRKTELVEMALRNAKALFIREQDTRSLKEKQLLELQETLSLLRYPRRIECLDTSNIAGGDAVASLVSFIHGQYDKNGKRLFKVRTQGDDYSAMKEVVKRHFIKAKEKGVFCDLFVVDGGKGQLQIVLDVFQELAIASVDVIAIAKEEARHDKGLTQEAIYLPHQKEPLWINPKSSLLFLLQNIRDEAHRAAISFHRKKRSERTLKSALDSLEGIGPIKKRRLLQHFKSVKKIQEASAEELVQVKGLSKKDIETILTWRK